MEVKVRLDWLAQVDEEIIDPRRRIVDPHHHFFVESDHYPHYTLESLWADMGGHAVEKTVYLQCWEGHRKTGPVDMQPVGETEWVDSIAMRARQNPRGTQIGGIVGTANLRGERIREVLECHVAASSLFRGIRDIAAFDACDLFLSMEGVPNDNLYGDPAFRNGFGVLQGMGLSFDAYHYHTQTPNLTAMMAAFPEAHVNLNHLGTPLGAGPYAGRSEEIYQKWSTDLRALAKFPNVTIKLGGLAMPWNGYGFENGERPPTSDELVARQERWYHTAIEIFGPSRCMFESNFPVDKCAVSYNVLWNAFKKMAARYSEAEQDAMFRGCATRFYRID